ncbi:MAG TPA: hypothetical protein VGW09_10885 [Nitrososphaeraceae archaeon]|nr:hypothetical protein [Nitrososphaeraceae archaeon]
MAFYLVKARPRMDLLESLREELSSGEISRMRPFGKSLQYSLENARIDTEDSNSALWVEEDYCSPPLAMEREAVLNQYFNDIIVEKVESEKEAWSRLKDKPRLWKNNDARWPSGPQYNGDIL